MTAFYSSKATPKRVFGEGSKLLEVFYYTLEQRAPGAWELNEAMLAMWNSQAYSHDWVLPDNFHVHIKVMSRAKETVTFLGEPYEVSFQVNEPMEGGRSLGANTIHSIDGMIVREMTRRCDFNPNRIQELYDWAYQESSWGTRSTTEDDQMVLTLVKHWQDSGYLSARILDHLTLENMGHLPSGELLTLLGSLPDKPFKLVSIHDCFRCLPHYGNDLRRQYNLQLELIAKSQLLEFIVEQLMGRKVPIQKLDPQLWQRIGATNYALS